MGADSFHEFFFPFEIRGKARAEIEVLFRIPIAKVKRTSPVPEIPTPKVATKVLLAATDTMNVISFDLTQLADGRKQTKWAVFPRALRLAGSALVAIPDDIRFQ
jgi:hypothetical protein